MAKTRFYHSRLIIKTSKRNYMKHFWEKDFDLEQSEWVDIYMRNVMEIKDRKIADIRILIQNLNKHTIYQICNFQMESHNQ